MADTHVNARLEAFSDGVFAIALTLLIIDVKIPPSTPVDSTRDLWLALRHTGPSIFAFVLSFGIILITWVNHHATLRLVDKSTYAFVYANGLLLLTVVFIPFPTALLGEHLLTDHASPAVILYSAACAFQAIGWNVMTRTALSPRPLTTNERATAHMRANHQYSYYAFALYAASAVVAIWLPLAVAAAITLIWIVWLIVGIRIRHE